MRENTAIVEAAVVKECHTAAPAGLADTDH